MQTVRAPSSLNEPNLLLFEWFEYAEVGEE